MVSPIHFDSWKAILQWCPNLELLILFLTGDRTIQHLLTTTNGLSGDGYYFPILHKFVGINQIKISEDEVFPLLSRPNLSLPTSLISLTVGLDKNFNIHPILPTTLTSLTLNLTNTNFRRGGGKALNLAALPASLVDLNIAMDTHVATIIWEKVDGEAKLYPHLSILKMTWISCIRVVLQTLISNAPAITALEINNTEYITDTAYIPIIPHPERIRKLSLSGMPWHRSIIKYLKLFPNVDLSLSLIHITDETPLMTENLSMLEDLIEVLPSTTTSLSIMPPLNLKKLERFTQLKELYLYAAPKETFDLILPSLRKLAVPADSGSIIAVPSTVTVLDCTVFSGDSSAGTYIIPPTFKCRELTDMTTPDFLSLKPSHISLLQKLTIDIHDHNITDICGQLQMCINLTDLVVKLYHANRFGELLDGCASITTLRLLDITILGSNSFTIDKLVLPGSLTTLWLHSYRNRVEVKTVVWPDSLEVLNMNMFVMPTSSLMSLKELRKIRDITVVPCNVGTYEMVQLLEELPTHLHSLIVQNYQSFAFGRPKILDWNDAVNSFQDTFPEVMLQINRRKRFIHSFTWDRLSMVNNQ